MPIGFEAVPAITAGLFAGAVMEGPVYLQKTVGLPVKQNIFRTWGNVLGLHGSAGYLAGMVFHEGVAVLAALAYAVFTCHLIERARDNRPRVHIQTDETTLRLHRDLPQLLALPPRNTPRTGNPRQLASEVRPKNRAPPYRLAAMRRAGISLWLTQSDCPTGRRRGPTRT